MLRSPNHRLPVRLRRALTIVVLALCAAFVLSLLSGISSALVHQLPHSFNPASLVPTAVTKFFERRTAPAKSVEATPLSPAPMFTAGTEKDFFQNTDMTSGTNYSPTGLPSNTNDVLLTTSSTALTISAANRAMGTLNQSNNTAYSISNKTTGATNSNLNLGGGGTTESITGSNGADLIFVGGTSSSLTIKGPNGSTGSGVLNAVALADGNLDVANSGATLNISSVVSGAFNLTKLGAGTLTLSGTNTFGSGKTFTFSAGTLNINSAAAVGGGTFAISGGTIDNTTGAAIGPFTNNNAQTWNGDFTFTGGATTTLDLDFGTGAISLGTTAGTTRSVTTSAGTLTFGGIISNGTTANSLTKSGAGTLTLSGASTYSGGTTLSAGSIVLGNKAALGSGTIAFNGVTTSASTDLQGANALTNNGTFGATGNVFNGSNGITFSGTFTNSVTSNTITNGITFLTFSGPFNLSDSSTAWTVTIDGSGATVIGGVIANGGGSTSNLAKSGAGNLGLSGVNTYSGTTTINAGT